MREAQVIMSPAANPMSYSASMTQLPSRPTEKRLPHETMQTPRYLLKVMATYNKSQYRIEHATSEIVIIIRISDLLGWYDNAMFDEMAF